MLGSRGLGSSLGAPFGPVLRERVYFPEAVHRLTFLIRHVPKHVVGRTQTHLDVFEPGGMKNQPSSHMPYACVSLSR